MRPLLKQLEAVASTEGQRITAAEMLGLLENQGDDAEFSASEWSEVVKFAAVQSARWQTAWLFSDGKAPDLFAKEQTASWDELWNSFADTLVSRVPGVQASLAQHRETVALHRAMQHRVQTLGRFSKALAATTSRAAFVFDSIGMRTLAKWLIRQSLYPAGSVGRVFSKPGD